MILAVITEHTIQISMAHRTKFPIPSKGLEAGRGLGDRLQIFMMHTTTFFHFNQRTKQKTCWGEGWVADFQDTLKHGFSSQPKDKGLNTRHVEERGGSQISNTH